MPRKEVVQKALGYGLLEDLLVLPGGQGEGIHPSSAGFSLAQVKIEGLSR